MRAPLNYLRSSPLGELLTGTAHEAHPTDITAPLGIRFAGQTILVVHTALDKAATVRATFDAEGHPRLTGIRNIKQRTGNEFVDVLRAEAAATGAEWVVAVLATGWQATLGQRAARAEPGDGASAFARHKLMFETPEVVVPRAQVDRVYTAVDHPVLDKSVVFSVKRRDLEDLTAEVRRAGLGLASIRIAVAAQLESWLATQGEGGLTRDLLLTDGLSALLLNAEQGDFVPPRGAIEAEQPRQAVQRPSAIEEDLVRFIRANDGRSLTFIGPEELCAAVKKQVPAAEIIRPVDASAHDTQQVALGTPVRHELAFDSKEVRPALARGWRRAVLGYLAAAVVLSVVTLTNAVYVMRTGLETFRLERESANRAVASAQDTATTAKLAADFADARRLHAWVAANYHAQRFCYRLLKEIPANAGLDKLQVELHDGQLALTFVVLGEQDAQLETHRAVERAIKDLRYKIGGEELPATAAGAPRAWQYRMHLIVPDSGEVVL